MSKCDFNDLITQKISSLFNELARDLQKASNWSGHRSQLHGAIMLTTLGMDD